MWSPPVQQTWIVIEKLNCKKQAWEKEENVLLFGKDGGLQVYHEEVVRAIHIAPKERTYIDYYSKPTSCTQCISLGKITL